MSDRMADVHAIVDYAGGGAANLIASVAAAFAGAGDRAPFTGLPPCPLMPVERLRAARHVVLLVVDGLGNAQLEAHVPDGALAAARIGTLCSVFPSTTASAITTYLTARTPAEHGLVGWHTWFPTLGVIGAPLPFTIRGTGESMERFGIAPSQLFAARGYLDAIDRATRLIHPRHLVASHYTRAHSADAEVRGFNGLDGLFREILSVAGGDKADYTYAYWPELDTRSHAHGSMSRPAGEHLARIDGLVDRLAQALRGTGTLLIVTADHGFVDTAPATRLRVADHPRLAECLLIPLTGEPRTVFCHVRPGAERDFHGYVSEVLGHACSIEPSQALIERGLFGPPQRTHPELAARIGHFTLLMRDNYVLVDRLPLERPFEQVGVHGGLSVEELEVPLIAIGP